MATINGLAIFVEKETVKREVESTSHPTEKGLPLTSNVQKQPAGLSIEGKIVNNGQYTAATINSKICSLMYNGSLITYRGRNVIKNLQIQSYESTHDKNNWGGLDFTMELKVVRIASPSYKKPTVETSKLENKITIKVGYKVVFKGGNVYVSSSAKTPASKRGRSTCKVTKVQGGSPRHPYHLISTDGKGVYGWVDYADIEKVIKDPSPQSKTNAGTQQITASKFINAVYHTTKKGDTVYNLVNKTYKSLGKSVDWVVKNNPNAFSKKGDPKTLKVGVKLLMGYKS